MNIQENVSIAPYTTLKIGGPARFFCSVKSEEELVEAVKFAKEKNVRIFVIGGGSNLLISDQGFNGLIIRCEIKGKEFISRPLGGRDSSRFPLAGFEGGSYSPQKDVARHDRQAQQAGANDDSNSVIVVAASGEDWESLVKEAVERGLYGFESLSAIPGTVGASPVQNIGAYGVDVSSTILAVRVLDTSDMQFKELSNADCKFGYRDSVFKHEKGRYIVTRVTYKLAKTGKPNLDYRDVREYFASRNNSDPTLKEVRDAVIEIRAKKLPDWKHWGTAGSFFKNPIISPDKFNELKKQYKDLPGYPEPDGRVKVSLGWILDKICSAKGLTVGNVGTYEKQALVLVTKPGATATEVINFSNELMRRVKEKTGIVIEGEVEWAVA